MVEPRKHHKSKRNLTYKTIDIDIEDIHIYSYIFIEDILINV